MEDSSKEEKAKQEISELEKLISEKDYAFDAEQWKRVKRTFLVLSGVIYLVMFMQGAISGTKEFFEWLIVAPVMAGFIMLISYGVLCYIMNGALKRAATISELKGRLFEKKYGKYK